MTFKFLSCLNVEPDELHVLWLGVVQYFMGSILWLLVYRCMCKTPKANMADVWREVTEHYHNNQTPTQFSNLDLKSFCNPDKHDKAFPHLKGRGAEVKWLVEPIANVWKKHKRTNTHDNRVLAALIALLAIIRTIDEYAHEMVYPRGVPQVFMKQIEEFLKQYNWLADQADARKDLLFSNVPKLHVCWHLGDRAKYLSTRRGACFIDEDYQRHLKILAQSCAHGTPLHQIFVSMMFKYRWALDYEHVRI